MANTSQKGIPRPPPTVEPQQSIEVPSLAKSLWAARFFPIIRRPFITSIVLQALSAGVGICSIKAIGVAMTALEGKSLETDTIAARLASLIGAPAPAQFIVWACLAAILFAILGAVVDGFAAWCISWSLSSLHRVATPQFMMNLVNGARLEALHDQEATVVQRWLTLKSVAQFYHNFVANSIGATIEICLIVLVAFSQNVTGGIVLCAMGLTWLAFVTVVSPKVLLASRATATGEEECGKLIRTAVSMRDSLRTPSVFQRFSSLFRPHAYRLASAVRREGATGSVLYGGLSGIASVGPVLVVGITLSVDSSSIGFATAATLYLLTSKISSPLSTISQTLPALQGYRIDFVRFATIYDNQTLAFRVMEAERPQFKSLTFAGIEHRYGDNKILSFPELRIQTGELHCVTGNSGIGKSTWLRRLAGRLPQPVPITVDDLCKTDNFDMIDAIAYLPQEPRLAEMTIADNLQLMAGERQVELNPHCANVFRKVVSELHGGDSSFVRSGVIGLSVGQRKAVCLINVLTMCKPICILDEPLTGVSPALQDELWQAIAFAAKTSVVIVALHETEYIKRSCCVTRLS
jgi:putative hydroxymethylpyrimidine transport system ATP-binding protein